MRNAADGAGVLEQNKNKQKEEQARWRRQIWTAGLCAADRADALEQCKRIAREEEKKAAEAAAEAADLGGRVGAVDDAAAFEQRKMKRKKRRRQRRWKQS